MLNATIIVNHIGTCRNKFLADCSRIGILGIEIKKPALMTTVIQIATTYFQTFKTFCFSNF